MKCSSWVARQCCVLKACGRLYAEMGDDADKMLPVAQVRMTRVNRAV